MYVVMADQVRSRIDADRVPAALDALASIPMVLGFERTAGDEIQGLAGDAQAVVDAVVALTRLDGWRIGVGVGSVDHPLPGSTRAARGPAYLAAREALDSARANPTGLALKIAGERDAGERDGAAAEDAETALCLLRGLLERRSPEGWEIVDLLDAGFSNRAAADQLGISPSAASQRAARAGRIEGARAERLADHLLSGLADTQHPTPDTPAPGTPGAAA